ncbi:MAG: BLUF domain-containing protein [Blastomonas sp.]
MLSLVYVSRPTSWQKGRSETLEDIQAVSIARNSMLDITGVLIATVSYIAQVLEGPASAVDTVMASILVDPRHCDIIVVKRAETDRRCFPLWRMLRFEEEKFADASLVPMLAALHAERGGEALRRFNSLAEAIARTHRR